MTSRAILIRDAVIDALNTGAPSGVPDATSRRAFPGLMLQGPVIGVFLAQEPARYPRDNNRSPIVERERMVVVQMGVVSEDVATLDDLAEELRAWVVSALGNTTLDNLALAVEDRGIISPDGVTVWNAGAFNMLVEHVFAVRYQTKRDNLEAAQ